MAGVSTLVQGKNCVFQVNFGDGYKPVVCAKGFTVSIDTELKETTSRGSGVHKEYDYKSLSYSVNLTGLVKVIDLDGDVIFFDLAFYQKNFLELPWKALFTDPNGTIKSMRGLGIVRSSVFTASAAQLADTTVDIQGTGEYFIEDDLATVCINDIATLKLNGVSVAPGSGLIIGNTTDLAISIQSLVNASPEIFRYDYEFDSAGRNSAFSSGDLPFDITTIEMSGYAPGTYVLNIWPVCDNGFDGTPFTVNITKQSPI